MSITRVAFYAPMKSPFSSAPSGDRTIARNFMAALDAAGCDVRLSSELRTWSRDSAVAAMAAKKDASLNEARALISAYRNGSWQPDVWFTYHLYYKAPDWIGPEVSRALNIPYVVAEATYAGKRNAGAWGVWQAEARNAMQRADMILCFTERDQQGLFDAGIPATTAQIFPPFLGPDHAVNIAPLSRRQPALKSETVRLLTIGMMRPGHKLESYAMLAQALRSVPLPHWHLTIVGDGDAVSDVRHLFDGLPSQRVTFLGQRDANGVAAELAAADLLVWPGIGEAFGMVYLEAQAAGVPVIACDTAGVSAVVEDGISGVLVPSIDPGDFAAALQDLMIDPERLTALSLSAERHVAERNAFPVAVETIGTLIRSLISAKRGGA